MPTSKMSKKEKLKLYEDMRKKYPPKIEGYTYEMYMEDLLHNRIRYIENMSAKEPLNVETLEHMLTSTDYFAEEKFDGIRGDLHFNAFVRSFTRNISKVTKWFTENTDNIPHIRDMDYPKDLYGTVLDGEYRILGGDFKDISSLMNCNFEEALLRQELTGVKPTFIAFDIIYYKGVYVGMLPLHKRQELLSDVIFSLKKHTKHILQSCIVREQIMLEVTDQLLTWLSDEGASDMFPTLAKEVYCKGGSINSDKVPYKQFFSKQAWYEYILIHGGEGLMLKDKFGKYLMKRGREYTKYKKFDTWDVIIMDYEEPTKEYTGKDESTWQYWYHPESDSIFEGANPNGCSGVEDLYPVTKHYAKGWIGTVVFGVIIDENILANWLKRNPKEKPPQVRKIHDHLVMSVGDTSGFTEEERDYITRHKEELIGKVIEVKGHERIKKTSRIRHPRFIRFREDKYMDDCTWENHQH